MPCVRVSPGHFGGTELSPDSPGERWLRLSPRCGPGSERYLRIPLPPEAGLRSRQHAQLSAGLAAPNACAGGHERNAPPAPGRSPRPHPPRAAQPRRCGEARAPRGHRAAAFPSVPDLGNRRLLAVNERPRGAARRGAPRCPSAEGSGEPGSGAERSGQGARRCPCRLSGGWGLPRVPRTGPLVISEVLEAAWGEVCFYLHIKRYRSH